MELTWGPTWSTSLKSLWTGDGEAIGDVAIGDELAEQLGSEPIHPVLLDLCTGVAFPAFPAVLAATEEGGPMADLFLPLRYGRVVLREKMPKRFYCRARWQTGSADSETQVFDLDFVDRDGRQLGEIRDFAVKRAPREALLRGLGGDATRNLYTLGWQEMPPPAESNAAGKGDGTWLIAGFDELSAGLPGSILLDRTSLSDPESWKRPFAQAAERGAPISGIVWRSTGQPGAEESTAEFAARLEIEIDQLLTIVRTLQAQQDVKLTGGLWIITEQGRGDRIRRVGRPGAVGAVGARTNHHRPSNRLCVAGWSTTTHSMTPCTRCQVYSAHLSTNPNSRCDKESTWCRGCCHGRAAALSRCPARLITSWSRPNAAPSTTFVSSRLTCRRRPRVRCRSG